MWRETIADSVVCINAGMLTAGKQRASRLTQIWRPFIDPNEQQQTSRTRLCSLAHTNTEIWLHSHRLISQHKDVTSTSISTRVTCVNITVVLILCIYKSPATCLYHSTLGITTTQPSLRS